MHKLQAPQQLPLGKMDKTSLSIQAPHQGSQNASSS